VKIPVKGRAKLNFSEENKSVVENVRISYSGTMAESVSNIEDARRVAAEMPKNLAGQLNTLNCTLLPLSLLDSKANRCVRSLDDELVAQTAATLKAGTVAGLELRGLVELDVFQTKFPAIKGQIQNLQSTFSTAQTEFKKNGASPSTRATGRQRRRKCDIQRAPGGRRPIQRPYQFCCGFYRAEEGRGWLS
jgi:hypothetical protein